MFIIRREHLTKEGNRRVNGELMCNPFVNVLEKSNINHSNTLRIDGVNTSFITLLSKDNVSKAIENH